MFYCFHIEFELFTDVTQKVKMSRKVAKNARKKK